MLCMINHLYIRKVSGRSTENSSEGTTLEIAAFETLPVIKMTIIKIIMIIIIIIIIILFHIFCYYYLYCNQVPQMFYNDYYYYELSDRYTCIANIQLVHGLVW